MEKLFEPYPEALELAAKAGDAQSMWLLGKDRVNKQNFENSPWYATERAYVLAAVKNRHPLAQMAWGKIILLSSNSTLQKRITGAKLWISGFIGARGFKVEPTLVRLLSLSRKKNNFHLDGKRNKFEYENFFRSGTGTCGVRIDYKSPEDCQIVLEFLPGLSVPSVTNIGRKIATLVVYHLLLSGVDISPEKILWYEAYPIGAFEPHEEGTLVSISFEWDGTTYAYQNWQGQPKQPIRIDLSDILQVPVYG